MVAPVAVGADPDLEQRRLVLLHRAVARRGERADPGAGPDQRVAARVLDLSLVAGAGRVHGALPHRRDLRLGHAGAEVRAHVLERERRELVREAHALDLLLGLDRARLREQRGRVGPVLERVEERARRRRRLAEHAVCGLRALAQLEPDALEAALAAHLLRELERARRRRPRIRLVIALEQAHVLRPRHPARVVERRLEADAASARPRAGRRRRRSPSSGGSSRGRGRCPARARRARRRPPPPSAP